MSNARRRLRNVGDMLITGVKGEIYPCKPDIFEATYERASASGIDLETLVQETAEELRHCIDTFEDGEWGFNIAMAKDHLTRAFEKARSL